MARWVYIPTAFFALAAWVGAQGPPPAPVLTAADQLRLLKTNATLIDNLVDHGVALSAADSVDKRAEQCRNASKALANAIHDAADKQEAERVAVLTDLFREVMRDGLLPTLKDGKRTVPPGSPAAMKLRDVREASVQDIAELKTALPVTGKVAESSRVKDAFKQLDEVAEVLYELRAQR
ncbi:hypothetical protein J8F10_22255 [Gemmata sp. G18]|uniref:Uncharacterized protein n=1 Tax=Gemmata palustris TaxID=2822762 RepID=A0ABS5BX58_9BACT|nr:hypothetical protein [Gemmata palustris]MBP3957987.1 hypothetical protein [Gemmata palustris]